MPSEDLRWRIIYQRLALGYSLQRVAENLGVAIATVHRVETLFDETGSVCKRKYPAGHGIHKLTETDELFILGLVLERPETYLHEIQGELQAITGTEVDISTICRCIHRNGFTRKKLKAVALQQSEILREQYREEVSIFKKEMFVFVDETGTDRRDSLRRFGYSLRGKRATSQKLLVRGQRVSAVGVLSAQGILDCHIVTGTVNAGSFEEFIEQSLLPHVMPFNGINPHSIVVLDNCSIHHVDHIVRLIESMGVLVLFLPPYSPDMMPIESAFSKAKSFLKANEIAFGAYNDPTDLVLAAFASITPEDCLGWIENCGY